MRLQEISSSSEGAFRSEEKAYFSQETRRTRGEICLLMPERHTAIRSLELARESEAI